MYLVVFTLLLLPLLFETITLLPETWARNTSGDSVFQFPAIMTKLIAAVIILLFTINVISKIILPHKLRYLENMLNADVVAKAAKIRQRLEANPNAADNDKSWPMLLAQYQDDKKQTYAHNGFYIRRPPNL